jgi:hypothetical protein
MNELLDLPTYRFSGDAISLGHAQGETFKTQLMQLLQLRFDHTAKYKKRSVQFLKQHLQDRALKSMKLLQKFDKENYQKTKAIVQAAGVDLVDYLITASVTDYRDISQDPEGCTSMVFRDNHNRLMGAQTWDLAEVNMPHVIMIHEVPDSGPERWTINCHGFPPLMGMNSYGVSVGTTNIKTRDVGDGLGYVHLIDLALNCKTARKAIEKIRILPRMASHTYWVVDQKDGFQLDTGHQFYQSMAFSDEVLVRTNHPTAEPLKHLQLSHPSLSSLMRKTQAEHLLNCSPHSITDIKAILADRHQGVESISRLSEDGTGITTNACFIAEPNNKTIWACRGPAQKGEWNCFHFEETYGKKESA